MRIVIFICLIGNSLFSMAQKIIIRETDSANYFSFVKLRNSKVIRYKESYDILNHSSYKFMTQWRAWGGDSLFWTNGENVYLCDISKKHKSKLLCKGLYWILELFVTNNYIYIVYNPSTDNAAHDNRYDKRVRLCRIRMGDWIKEDLPLPKLFNITNIVVSFNHSWVSFINTKAGNVIKYQMVLLNIKNKKVTIIDSADAEKNEWFGDDDKFNSSIWVDSNTLLYYKNTSLANWGEIVKYNLTTKDKKIILRSVPERDFSWFGYYNGYFYFSKKKELYRTKDGIQKETIYIEENKFGNILEAIVLPQ